MNKKAKTFRSLVCIVLSVLMVLSLFISVVPALAVSEDELQKLAIEMALLEQEAQEQQELIDKLDTSKTRFIDRKLMLDAQIKINQDAITLLESRIRLYDEMIATKEQELAEAKPKLLIRLTLYGIHKNQAGCRALLGNGKIVVVIAEDLPVCGSIDRQTAVAAVDA